MLLAIVPVLATRSAAAEVEPLVGIGVSGNWVANADVDWYGNVIASVALWRGPIGIVVDGGLSATGADRGELWGGFALRVSPFTTMVATPVYTRIWLEAGAGYERWAARDDAHPTVSRRVLRAAVGYDLAEHEGWGTQAFARVLHGDAIVDAFTTELGATTLVIGIGVLRDL